MPTKSELAKAASKYISTKKVAKPTVAKKDSTNVARKRVSQLVGDKPNYSYLEAIPDVISGKTRKTNKTDSTMYEFGFREQISRDKKAGKSTKPYTALYDSMNQGRQEASERRKYNDLDKKATVRDSSIPLAPTQFPDQK